MDKKEALTGFVEFNPTRFLNESRAWKTEIAKQKKKLAEISELPAIQSSGVQTSNISDMTARQGLKELEILEEIEKYEFLMSVKAEAIENLNDVEKEVIKGFFFGRAYITVFIEEFGRKHFLCRSDVYKLRRETLDKISRFITEKYNL